MWRKAAGVGGHVEEVGLVRVNGPAMQQQSHGEDKGRVGVGKPREAQGHVEGARSVTIKGLL